MGMTTTADGEMAIMADEEQAELLTDTELEALVAQSEAGVADLLEAHRLAEASYFPASVAASSHSTLHTVASSHSTAR
jgi:hypothetical protein